MQLKPIQQKKGMVLNNHVGRHAKWAILPLCMVLAIPSFAQTWKVNLRDADINAFVAEVADITGKNFVVDPRVKGTVTVISNRALTKEQVYDLFLGVMSVNGVAAVADGNTTQLLPDSSIRQAAVPFDFRHKANGNQIVTRVLWLENTSANDLIPALRPLMPQFAHLASVAGTNALVVSDRAENIDQLEGLVRNLDGGDGDKVEYVTLKNTTADELIDQIEGLTGITAGKDAKQGRVKVLADTRTNRIIIKGDVKSRQRIKDLVNQLDVESASKLNGIRIFKLQHASAKNISSMLQALMNNASITSTAPTNNLTLSNSFGSNNGLSNANNTLGSPPFSTPSLPNYNPTSSSLGSSANNNNKNQEPVSIIADESQNAVVVKASAGLMRDIEQAIKQLDQRRNQVLIEAAIVEVSGGNLDQLGVQWAFGNPASGAGVINFSNVGTSLTNLYGAYAAAQTGGISTAATALGSVSGAMVGLGDSRRNSSGQTSFYGAIIQALNSSTKSNLLSVPSVMTLDNEEANILVGQNVPFISGTTALSVGTSTTSVSRQDVGVSLKVIPHVGESGAIRLEIVQEVSAIAPTVSDIKSYDLITNKRSIKTSILADNQQTIVLGGLMKDDSSSTANGVPYLSKIPVLGGLFRSRSESHTKSNLYVFLRPTILKDGSGVNTMSQQNYQRLRSVQFELDPTGQLNRLPEDTKSLFTDSFQPVVITPNSKKPVTPVGNTAQEK